MRLPLIPVAVGLLLTGACAPARPPLEPDPPEAPVNDVVVASVAAPKGASERGELEAAPAAMAPPSAKAKRAVKPPSTWKLNGKSVSTALEVDALYALDEADERLRTKWTRTGGIHLCAHEGAEYTLSRGAAQYRLVYWAPTTPDSLVPCPEDDPKPKDVKVGPNATRVYDEAADVLMVVEPIEQGTKAEAKKIFDAVFKK